MAFFWYRVMQSGPAFIKTPMISKLEEDAETLKMLTSLHPIGRLGTPEEVGGIGYLAEFSARFVRYWRVFRCGW